jgi:hypothetical protein
MNWLFIYGTVRIHFGGFRSPAVGTLFSGEGVGVRLDVPGTLRTA